MEKLRREEQMEQIHDAIKAVRAGALKNMFFIETKSIPDPTTYPSSSAHPLILEIHSTSSTILQAICDVIRNSKDNHNNNPIDVKSTYLDLKDGSNPKPLIHLGFTSKYLASNLRLSTLSDSEQKVRLLAFIRRIRLQPSTLYGRSVLFADDQLPEELHAAFDAIDADQSGFIDLKEIEQFIENHNRAKAILKEYDTDGDGRINYTEWSRHGLLDFLQLHNILKRTFIRHNPKLREKLFQKWNQSTTNRYGLTIPRPDVKHYLGNDSCMYFEFITFYTWSVMLLAMAGLLLVVFKKADNGLYMLGFTVFTVIWSSIALGLWKQRQHALEELWTPNQKPQQEFLTLDQVGEIYTGRQQSKINIWRLRIRRTLTIVGSLFLLYFIFKVDLWILYYKIDLDKLLNKWLKNDNEKTTRSISYYWQFEVSLTMKWYIYKTYSLIPSAMKASVMTIFDTVFSKVVELFIQFEKRKTKAEENDSKMIKFVLFHFVSKFLYLFYFSFIEQDLNKLRQTLLSILVLSIFFQNFKEIFVPWCKTRWFKAALLSNRRMEMGNEKNEDASQSSILVLTAMEEDYLRKEYQNTFEDYLELLLQWAHIMLFASVFPLGGFLALLNNLYETKGDSYKVLFEMNPMLPRDERLGDQKHHFAINLWVKGFVLVSYLSLVTNLLLLTCDFDSTMDGYQHWLLGLEHSWFEGGVLDSAIEVLAVMTVFEHVLLFIKATIAHLMPEHQKSVITIGNVAASYKADNDDFVVDEDDHKNDTKNKVNEKKSRTKNRTKSRTRS